MKISRFQIIVLAIFVFGIVLGVVAFATYKGSSSNNALPPITVWGTFPKATFDGYVAQVNQYLPQQVNVNYVQESPDTFQTDFISALARGQGPDAILIPADLLLPNEDKLIPIPYTALPERTFLDTYIQEASLYLSPNGVLAIPFSVDPLVMYWDRDMFNAAGVAEPPAYWDDFTALNKAITVKSSNGTVTTSAAAMGDFSNVDNARELLATLFMQLGNPVTSVSTAGAVTSALSGTTAPDPLPAVNFFAQFVDPTSPDYSWNASWPDSESAFLSGTLATYFGFASELSDIRAKNPNLNFDVAALPQTRTGGQAAVYAQLYGFSLVRASAKANAAYEVISTLVQPQYLAALSQSMYLPSVDLATIQSGSTDPYITIFDREALIARGWLDSGPAVSGPIFSSLVQAVTSGEKQPEQALQDANSQYNVALQQAAQQ